MAAVEVDIIFNAFSHIKELLAQNWLVTLGGLVIDAEKFVWDFNESEHRTEPASNTKWKRQNVADEWYGFSRLCGSMHLKWRT